MLIRFVNFKFDDMFLQNFEWNKIWIVLVSTTKIVKYSKHFNISVFWFFIYDAVDKTEDWISVDFAVDETKIYFTY